MKKSKPQLPEGSESFLRAHVQSLIDQAFLAGMERAKEICETVDPHPDQYSDDSEFVEKHTVLECIKRINIEMRNN